MSEPTPIRRRRRRTFDEKLTVVLAADMTSTLAAATAIGANESTVRYWLDQPQFAKYRENARAATAEEAVVVTRMAWQELGRMLAEHILEPRDVIMATGMATEKAALLNGQATSRNETLTGGMDDHERDTLKRVIARVVEELPV